MLTERQQKARDLARWIETMRGAHVVSPMPLAPDANGIRVQIEHPECNFVVGALQDQGFKCQWVRNAFRTTYSGFNNLAAEYEVLIDRDRQPIHDDRTIRGEISSGKKKPDTEVEKVMKHLGYKGY